MSAPTADDHDIDSATGKALAMVAIEMILTLGQQLGKGFDLGAYADAIAESGHDPLSRTVDRRARENVVAILRQLSRPASV